MIRSFLKVSTTLSPNKTWMRKDSTLLMKAWRSQLNFARLTISCQDFPICLSETKSQEAILFHDNIESFLKNNINARKNDEDERVDPIFYENFKTTGAFGVQAPTEYNGLGLNNTMAAYLYEVVGKYDLGIGVILAAHQSIGYKGILLYGTEAQKSKYIPKLASGEQLACFCLTEPEVGSDASSVKTTASYDSINKQWVINGSKIWISNGDTADVFTVFAKTIIPGSKIDGMTAFIVERNFTGVKSGKPDKKMGIKCSHSTEVNFDNVVVPEANVLGDIGTGFKVAVNILNSGRFGMGAAMVGSLTALAKKSYDHSITRKQFGRSLFEFQDIRVKIANMISLIYANESMLYYTSGLMDLGVNSYDIESAALKIFSSESAWYVCDETIQILGGMGYMKESGVEKVMRDLRIFRIFEGTNDILRQYMFFKGLTDFKSSNGLLLNMRNSGYLSTINSRLWAPSYPFYKLRDTYLMNFMMFAVRRQVNQNNQFIARSLADLQISIFAINAAKLRLSVTSEKTKSSEELLLNHLTNQLFHKQFPTEIEGVIRLMDSADKVFKVLHANDGQFPSTHPILFNKQ